MTKVSNKSLFCVNVLVVIALIFLVGPSFAAPQRMYSGPEKPASETALVMGATMEINIESCDGVKVSKLEVTVLPGEHTVEMSPRGSTSNAFLKFTADAGHTYIIDVERAKNIQGAFYHPFILDKTTGKRVSQLFIPPSKLEERLEKVDKWTKEHPQSANFWAEKGDLLNKLKRYSEALSALETAVSLKSDDGAIWNVKSFSLYQLGRYEEALADIEKAIKLRGNDNDKKGKETILKKIEERKSTTPREKYEGNIVDGKRTGKGTLTWPNGDKFEGDFVNDHRTGKGILTYANGNRYEGDFVNDKLMGKGTYTRANGEKYEGDFVDNKPTGKGVGIRPNGDMFEGDFVNGIPHGKGTVTWANGDRYEGNLVKGKPSGEGTVTRANGTKCTAVFQDGQPVGGSSCTVGDTGF